MAARFTAPGRRGRSLLSIKKFLGVDFTNHPTNVDVQRSPGAVNMIRDVPGKVRKMMGYERMAQYEGCINGVFYLFGQELPLVHAGTGLYRGQTLLRAGVADARSSAWQFGDCLYFLDGREMLRYDGGEIVPVSEVAYIPTVSIANSPAGNDGAMYEDLNLLQRAYTESFLGTATATQYQLGFAPLDTRAVDVQVLDSGGNWQARGEGTHFYVNRATGVVTFYEAPGVSPVTGEDNVRITARRTVAGYAERINGCRIGTRFGVSGAPDRLFVSGNPAYPNLDWYSGQNDPTYFGDRAYSVLGSGDSAIMGYSLVNGRLAAHKDEAEPERNILLREGTLVDGKAAFPVVNSLQGAGAVSRQGFGYLAAEPLFLTRLGVYAVTPQDITGEKYAQNRSFYLNGRLLEEAGLEEAFCHVYKDFFFVCVNGRAYILDGLQPFAPEKSMPYSTRQYAGFYRENLPARVMYEREGRLWFGSGDGALYRFYDAPEDHESYNDAGAAIRARWETPDIDGRLFYHNKRFQYLAVRLAAGVATGVAVYSLCRGEWRHLRTQSTKGQFLHFGQLDFGRFTFSGDATPKLLSGGVRLGRADRGRFALENAEYNESFGLFDIALEYSEGGRARG